MHSLAFNALVRLTGYQYKVEPYTGIGIGLNVGNISEGNFQPEASFAPSFNILVGTRYYVTPKIAPFIEYKYNFAQFTFSQECPHNGLSRQPLHVRHLFPLRQLRGTGTGE